MLVEQLSVAIFDFVDLVEVGLVGEDLVGGVSDDSCAVLVSEMILDGGLV